MISERVLYRTVTTCDVDYTYFGQTKRLPLPKGCVGIQILFESVDALKEFAGEDCIYEEVAGCTRME